MRKLKHAEIPRPSPAEIGALPRHPVTVVLDDIRSIHNVGSIFRTSDAALIEQVILCGITGTPDHPDLHKTALGAQDTTPWSYEADVMHAVTRLKQNGYRLAVLEITDTPAQPSDLVPGDFPLALVVGHEVFGVKDDVIAAADVAIEIPQYGTKQSLNVSVAYGIAIYAIVNRYCSLREAPQEVNTTTSRR